MTTASEVVLNWSGPLLLWALLMIPAAVLIGKVIARMQGPPKSPGAPDGKESIVWRCDECGAFQIIKNNYVTSPTHAGCGGQFRVWLTTKMPRGKIELAE